MITAQLNDADGDGLSDAWEEQYGSSKNVANAAADFDRDHVDSALEAASGTNPTGRWKLIEIPLPQGVNYATMKLNIHGNVMMRGYRSSTQEYLTAVWHRDSPSELQEIAGIAVGYDWNDDGEIVGRASHLQLGPKGRHYRPWDGTHLYELSDELEQEGDTWPTRINNLGEISGWHSPYGPFYQNIFGYIDSFRTDVGAESLQYAESFYFSDINDYGSAIGGFNISLGGPDENYLFFYQQSDPTRPGYFFATEIPTSAPLYDSAGAPLEITYLYPSHLNNFNEFLAVYFTSDNLDRLLYFDGELQWEIELPDDYYYPWVIGLNDWPQWAVVAYNGQTWEESYFFVHDHIWRTVSELDIRDASGSPVVFTGSPRIMDVSNRGHLVLQARLASEASDRYFLVELDQDQDHDGLPDDWELAYEVSDPAADEDGDGLTNYQEFFYNLDPRDAESNSLLDSAHLSNSESRQGIDDDGDGIPNTVEVFWGLDPDDPTDAGEDTDGDGLTNLEEFVAGTSALAIDSDRDGVSDHDEIAQGTDPRVADFESSALSQGVLVLTPLQ